MHVGILLATSMLCMWSKIMQAFGLQLHDGMSITTDSRAELTSCMMLDAPPISHNVVKVDCKFVCTAKARQLHHQLTTEQSFSIFWVLRLQDLACVRCESSLPTRPHAVMILIGYKRQLKAVTEATTSKTHRRHFSAMLAFVVL